MNTKWFIHNEYRHTAPDADSTTGGGGDIPPTPEVEEPAAQSETETPPADNGQDTIPESNLWDTLSKDMEDTDDEVPEDSSTEEVSPEPVAEVTPEPPAKEEPKPAIETPAETPPEVTPPVVEAAEIQPTTAPEPKPEVTPPPEIDVDKQRLEMTERLEAHYQLSEEESLQMVTDPGKALPKLQAKMFSDMWWNMTQMIRSALPTVIESTLRDVKVRDGKVDSFFQQWPKLTKAAHGAQVAQVAKVYAQVNPTATEADVIKHVGMQVMLMAGITPEMTPVNPETPPAETPAAPLTPHRPAAVNALGGAQQLSGGIWAEMAEDLLDDD